MTTRTPRVSVCLAVYNGEPYVRAAIDAMLNQTFQDFELIISDNASTDGTQAICENFAAQDTRIRYYRHDVNRGATWNLNHVLGLATGEYSKLMAHDDLHANDFLEKCVAVLDRDPSVVLCHSWTRTIDAQGEALEDQRDGNINAAAPRYQRWWRRLLNPIVGDGQMHADAAQPRVRFRSMVGIGHSCHQCFGVVRTAALHQTGLFGSYAHADGVMLAKLALMGRIYIIPEYLFYNRKHTTQSMNIYRKSNGRYDYLAYALWWDPSKQGKIILPTWKMLSEYCRAIAQANVSAIDKIWCYFDMVRWVRWAWASLLGEILIAGRQLVKPSTRSNAV